MRAARYLTLCWPGLPWLWLRGSLMGLVLAVAFAVALDVAVITTWIWSELVDLPIAFGIWAATIAIFVVATASAVQAFPPALPDGRDPAIDALFGTARDAYLARDWTAAETRLRDLLARAPTDGEAQLLLATLLRRVGRFGEARIALEQLSRADTGGPWRSEIDRELARLDDGPGESSADDGAVSLPIRAGAGGVGVRDAAA